MSEDPNTEPEAGEPTSVDFGAFILSLATNALVHLGVDTADDKDRIPGRARVDLKVAAQHIDILAMLETKTRGNLDPAELALLQSVLYDLRMQFLEASTRKS